MQFIIIITINIQFITSSLFIFIEQLKYNYIIKVKYIANGKKNYNIDIK